MKGIFASCLFLSFCTFGSTGCGTDDNQGTTVDAPPPNNPGPTNPPGPPPVDMPEPVVPTDFMVMRVGTGTSAMVNNVATAAFIERRKIADGSLVGQARALPTAANGDNHMFTLSGSGTTEGALTLSGDGHYLLFAGYDAAPGTASVVDTALRVVGRMNTDGSVDTTTAVDGLNGTGNNVRSATSTDGNALWVSGVLGIAYTTLGHVGNPIAKPLGSTANSRVLGILDGQLYVSRASDASGGISTVGQGAPTTDNVPAKQLAGFPSGGNVYSPYSFLFLDQDGQPGKELMYVADDRIDGNGGIQRFRLNNNTWTLEGTLSVGATSGCRGLAGFVSLSGVVLIASTSESGSAVRLVTFVDPLGATTVVQPKVLLSASTNTAFRGVSLPPTQ